MKARENTADLLYGIHAVCGILRRNPRAVRAVWFIADGRQARLGAVEDLAEQHGIPLARLDAEEFERRARGVRHQGVLAEVEPGAITGSESDIDGILASAAGPPFLLVLDGVQDPHNLGACLRTADAAGAHAVIVPKDRAAGLTPTVCKVASGAVGHLPFIRVTNLARTLRRLREANIWIAGVDMGGDTSLYDADLAGPLALVMGAEGSGLRRLTREYCDWLVSIPMAQGAVESLNISVAAGISLFEVRRQRAIVGR